MILDDLTVPRTELVTDHPAGKLVCHACAHRCKLSDQARGVCMVRFRDQNAVRVPWGYTAGVAVDPIEKKPLFHVRPGSHALSFGMLGCDLHCDFCQNWLSSQVMRDDSARARAQPVTAEELVNAALQRGCAAVVSTYNEPLISAEWAHDVFTAARQQGLLTGFVSNGHGTPEVVDYLEPVLDFFKVDLKAFRERSYRTLGGQLQPVLDTIADLHGRGIWVEVVTLVVPGFNDDPQELRELAAFLAGVSPSIPWHVTAFHPDYRMTDRDRTPADSLRVARAVGLDAGLHHVYAGNLPGELDHAEDTRCLSCSEVLIERLGFRVVANRLEGSDTCPHCGARVAGIW